MADDPPSEQRHGSIWRIPMLTTHRLRALRRMAVPLGALLLVACATRPSPTESIAPPHFVIGDHWEYRITDGLRRGATTRLDVQVVAVNAGVATMRMVYTNDYGRSERTEEIGADGGLRAGSLRNEVARRFSPPLKLLDFPIGEKSPWRQTVDTFRNDTQLKDDILIYGEVQGRAPVTVPAGSFDTVAIYRIVQLDDDEFWRSRTTRRDSIRYAPEVKGIVREIRDAEYFEVNSGPDSSTIRTEYTTTELVSFTPGK
jgi:hypothetical protein